MSLPAEGRPCFPRTLRRSLTGLWHCAIGLLVSCGLCLGAGGAPPDHPRGRPDGSGWARPISRRGSGMGESCRLCPGVAQASLHWTFSPNGDGIKPSG